MDAVILLLARHVRTWCFGLLLACGLGLPPWSEELVLLGTGTFVARGDIGLVEAMVWCTAGLLGGDSIIYALGRFWGETVFNWMPFRRLLKPSRRERFNRSFQRRGAKAIFLARFFPGIRLVAYFVAGHMRMSFHRFLLLDLLGALLSVPISVYLGKLFADNLDLAMELLHRYSYALAGAAFLAGLGWWAYRKRRRRLRREARRAAEQAAQAASESSGTTSASSQNSSSA